MTEPRDPRTLLAHLGSEANTTGHVTGPIVMSTTFSRDADYNLRVGIDYARDQSPAYLQAQAALATLEGGRDAMLFGSGMAAANAVFSSLRPGDHAVVSRAMYWALRAQVQRFGADFGVAIDLCETWREGEREYTEWLLVPCTPLYAIGAFATTAADTVTARAEHQAMADLLAEWKSRPAELHARFDLDSDGQLGLREWELARLEARRELRRHRAAAPAAGALHTLQRPRDGRLFLLANEMPERIGLRYRWWAWGHLALFLVLGGGGLWLLHLPGGGAMP